MSNSSQTQVSYVAESTYGTTPATPTMLIQRITSEGLKPNIQNETSAEIQADRNVRDMQQVGSAGGGPVSFEMSYGTFDDWLESLMFSTWSTNVLKNGVTQKSFTIEKLFETGATDQYHRFLGSIVNSMSLSIQANSLVKGSFDFVAKQATSAQAAITGSSYTAANTNAIISAATNFAALAMTGLTSPKITQINLNVSNGLRPQPVVGSLNPTGYGTGRFEVTGEVIAYFENEEAYELFLAGTAADLTFEIGGTSSSKYEFVIGNLKFEDCEVLAGGNDQDVMARLPFRGLYDGTDNTLQITRTP